MFANKGNTDVTVINENGDHDLSSSNSIAMVQLSSTTSEASKSQPLTDIGTIELESDQSDSTEAGISIKPSIVGEVRGIKRQIARQVFYSLIRNGLCWMAVACAIVIIVGRNELKIWLEDERVSVIVLMILGLVGVPFQAVHAVRDFKGKTKQSRMAYMLRHSHDVTKFLYVMNQRKTSPPNVTAEISLRTGAIANDGDPDHWMKTSRKKIKVLTKSKWTDRSAQIEDFNLDTLKSFWIIVAKNYRYLNKGSEKMTSSEMAQFKKECEFDKYLYFMRFEYILDLEEGDYFPDVEACLVYEDDTSCFYQLKAYKICICLALDFVYQILFFCKTKHVDDYKFVKYISR